MDIKLFPKNNKLIESSRYFLTLVLAIWIFVSLFRIGYDLIQFIPQTARLFFLSQEQKRGFFYGNEYTLFRFVSTHVKRNDDVLIISKDGKAYFLLRYLLYPQKVYWNGNPRSIQAMDPIIHYRLYLDPQDFSSIKGVVIRKPNTNVVLGKLVRK